MGKRDRERKARIIAGEEAPIAWKPPLWMTRGPGPSLFHRGGPNLDGLTAPEEVREKTFAAIKARGWEPRIQQEEFDISTDDPDYPEGKYSSIRFAMYCPHGVWGDTLTIESMDDEPWEPTEGGDQWEPDGCDVCMTEIPRRDFC